MRINTVARFIVFPDSYDKIKDVLKYLSDRCISFLVIGNLSNVIFKDDFYDGAIIKTTKLRCKNEAEYYIELSSGLIFSSVIRQLSMKNKGGFEGLCGIPGTVGGMLKQNAGAFGFETSDNFLYADLYDLSRSETVRYSKSDMCFSYRHSVLFDERLIVLSAAFSLVDIPREKINSDISDYIEKRRRTQPLSEPSLGSVFKKVDGVSAGYYIEKAGLKGYKIGGACVSAKHAGFIVNSDAATAKDILSLIEFVKERVYADFGIELEEEIEII